MQHRNLVGTDWNPMAIDSLFSRGTIADWREFVRAMKSNPQLAVAALAMGRKHEDQGSAALARILVSRYHPHLVEAPDHSLAR